jgi:hypothetical protein
MLYGGRRLAVGDVIDGPVKRSLVQLGRFVAVKEPALALMTVAPVVPIVEAKPLELQGEAQKPEPMPVPQPVPEVAQKPAPVVEAEAPQAVVTDKKSPRGKRRHWR